MSIEEPRIDEAAESGSGSISPKVETEAAPSGSPADNAGRDTLAGDETAGTADASTNYDEAKSESAEIASADEDKMEDDADALASSGNAKENGNDDESRDGEGEDENDMEDDADSKDDNGDGVNVDVDPVFDQMLMKPLFERREKSLKELLEAMDEFSPIIPDAVTDYYLTRAGFKTSDHRIKRLLALATQKFISDIANDAYQYSRIRTQSGNLGGATNRSRAPGGGSNRTLLTMDSLSGVLGDYGVNTKRPDFYR